MESTTGSLSFLSEVHFFLSRFRPGTVPFPAHCLMFSQAAERLEAAASTLTPRMAATAFGSSDDMLGAHSLPAQLSPRHLKVRSPAERLFQCRPICVHKSFFF